MAAPFNQAFGGFGTSDMAREVAAFNWAATAIGPIDSWPRNLRTSVGICLNSRFPMFVWWGPELINIHNDAYIPVLGARKDWALGEPARRIWDDIWPNIGAEVDQVMKGQAVSHVRERLVMQRNGYAEETFFTYSHSPIPDDAGGIGGLFQVCYDETAIVQAERSMQQRMHEAQVSSITAEQQAELFNTALTYMNDFAYMLNRDGRFIYANKPLLEIWGLREEEALGRTFFELPYPKDMARFLNEQVQNVFKTGERILDETPYTGANGQVGYYEYVFSPIFGSTGKIEAVMGTSRETTKRRNAEMERERLRHDVEASEQKRRLALDSAELGSWHIDLGTLEMTGDARFCEILGLDAYTMTYEDTLAVVHEADRDNVRRALDASMDRSHHVPYAIEYRVCLADGRTRWVSARGNSNIAHDEYGESVSLDGTVADITDRKIAEDEREQLLNAERNARSEAERAGRMKDEFLATLSHEIRTPLNAIIGWSHIMKHSTDPADIQRGLEVIERNARIQSQIIEDLLDMSSIISGKIRIDLQPIDLARYVTDAVSAALPTAEAKRIVLESAIDAVDDGDVRGDAARIQQILWNLINNAIKFTRPGGRVDVTLARVNSHVEIRVRDTGEGIAPEFLPYVFDRFRQADASTTRRHGGLGLGLAIVRQLAELHGGSVRAESDGLGLGTTFIVSLPVSANLLEAARVPDRPAPITPDAARFNDACDDLIGVRVIILDDEPDARQLLKRLLQDCGAVVTAAESTDEVVRRVQTETFDVLVSDIGMPGEDGYSLIRRVRRLGAQQHGDIPAIALTAYARAGDRRKALAAGFQMHISKPVEPNEIIALVARAAGRQLRPRPES
ncbi:MAG: ATP-binding protein [Gemmatimonas sp.]